MKFSVNNIEAPTKIMGIMLAVLIGSVGFGLNMATHTGPEPASTTAVSVLPSSVNARIGQSFTVDVNITDVTNLYAYEMKIWYKNTVINGTSIIRPPGHILEPSDPLNQYVAKWEIKNDYNSTHGRIWVAFSLLAPEVARTGSGILLRVTFKGLSEGTTPIVLNNYPGTLGPVSLVDSSANPIPHVGVDGEATISTGITISVTRIPAGSPNYDEEVTVTAQITCPVGIHVDSAILSHSYTSTQGSGQINATMAPIGGDYYRAKIPKYPYLAYVEYKVLRSGFRRNLVHLRHIQLHSCRQRAPSNRSRGLAFKNHQREHQRTRQRQRSQRSAFLVQERQPELVEHHDELQRHNRTVDRSSRCSTDSEPNHRIPSHSHRQGWKHGCRGEDLSSSFMVDCRPELRRQSRHIRHSHHRDPIRTTIIPPFSI